jgi:S-adenosylmethionine:tRNA-ribosyltransferase-isomerase (queuine synthetase)
MSKNTNELESYNYKLPKTFIAQHPHFPADECKLLTYNQKENTKIKGQIFKDIIKLIDPTTTIFFNNSKVIKARLPLINIKYEHN